MWSGRPSNQTKQNGTGVLFVWSGRPSNQTKQNATKKPFCSCGLEDQATKRSKTITKTLKPFCSCGQEDQATKRNKMPLKWCEKANDPFQNTPFQQKRVFWNAVVWLIVCRSGQPKSYKKTTTVKERQTNIIYVGSPWAPMGRLTDHSPRSGWFGGSG